MAIALTVVDDDGIETEVDEDELYEAGWIKKDEADVYASDCKRDHCTDQGCGLTEDDVRAALHRHHEDAGHRFALRFCDEEPCKALVQAGAA